LVRKSDAGQVEACPRGRRATGHLRQRGNFYFSIQYQGRTESGYHAEYISVMGEEAWHPRMVKATNDSTHLGRGETDQPAHEVLVVVCRPRGPSIQYPTRVKIVASVISFIIIYM